MAFTEFCCKSTGSNLNAGTRTGDSTVPGDSADFTYASGSWVASTGVFTVASGNPSSDGVAVGDFASVYADGASVTTLVGRVTARDATTITVSTTAKVGTTTDGTSNRTLKIGGAWQGPNGTNKWPWGTLSYNALTNTAGNGPRINLCGTFAISATLGNWTPAACRVEGFTTSYGDGGIATIDGGTTGASYSLTGILGRLHFKNIWFKNNGGTGSADGVINSTQFVVIWERCTFSDFRGSGLGSTTFNGEAMAIDCIATRCNQSNTVNKAGFASTIIVTFLRCIATGNTGSNTAGFYFANSLNPSSMIQCRCDNNGGHGVNNTGPAPLMVDGCDFYQNGGSGIRTTAGYSYLSVSNSNFIKNAAWGIDPQNTVTNQIVVRNCGFGSGSQANASGTVNHPRSEDITNTVTYASEVTPWVDPSTGNFAITLAAAKNVGFGTMFDGTTVGYPDIGAAQATASGGGARIPNINGGADQ